MTAGLSAIAEPAIAPSHVRASEGDNRLAIAQLAIPTSLRPSEVRRHLPEYLANCAAADRRVCCTIFDDSPDPAARAAYREVLREARRTSRLELRYAGVEQKLKFVKRVIDSRRVPADVVKTALFDLDACGLTTLGANLNAILLATAGEPVVVVDDDTSCRVGRMTTGPRPGRETAPADDVLVRPWTPGGEFELCDVWSFESRDAALDAVTFEDRDYLALHERALSGGPSSERVIASLHGLAGDCGWGTPAAWLFLSQPAFARLTASADRYQAACVSREIVKHVERPTLTNRLDNFMSTFMGLDNRALLPPFKPVGRGSDLAFGHLLSTCHPDAWLLTMPCVLPHAPPETRRFSPGEIGRSASGTSLSSLFAALLRAWIPSAPRPARALPAPPSSSDAIAEWTLAAIGSAFEDLAALPHAAFVARVHEHAHADANVMGQRLDARLAAMRGHDGPWTEDLRASRDRLARASSDPAYALPLDLRQRRGEDEAWQVLRRLLARYGRLLQWWPALRDEARRLRAAGHPLSEGVTDAW
jgi:hypothetical protein